MQFFNRLDEITKLLYLAIAHFPERRKEIYYRIILIVFKFFPCCDQSLIQLSSFNNRDFLNDFP